MQLTAAAPGAVDHQLYITDILALDFKGVDESGGGYDGGAVLVVVHHGYVAFLFQTLLDFKTFGRFDILEVYAAECRSQRFHNLDKFFRVFSR